MTRDVDLFLRCDACMEIRNDELRLYVGLPPQLGHTAFHRVHCGQPDQR